MGANAGFLVIGDEILSGKTRDKNIGVLADALTMAGIDLEEVRVVVDRQPAIVEALNAMRARFTYVFTSGGIGPTHDDITADAVADAFGVPISVNRDAFALLSDFYAASGREMNPARERMTRIPNGAVLIANPVSIAPGFRIGNVHVMAGVPSVFSAMLESVLPTLHGGVRLESVVLAFHCGEGDMADALRELASAHGEVGIGSYPKIENGRFTTEIVLRSRNGAALDAAVLAAQKLRSDLNAS